MDIGGIQHHGEAEVHSPFAYAQGKQEWLCHSRRRHRFVSREAAEIGRMTTDSFDHVWSVCYG